jgi:hypothetical protein
VYNTLYKKPSNCVKQVKNGGFLMLYERFDALYIVNFIVDFIKGFGDEFEEWYVGITGDIEERLFGFHQVNREEINDYIFFYASTEDDAREAERILTEDIGTEGNPGGDVDFPIAVYAYKIKETTKER